MTAFNTKTSLTLTLGLALVAMPLAFAGQHGKQAHEAMFKKMDSNGDGKVTRVEHTAGAKLMFTKADTNKDNALTLEECIAGGMMSGGMMKH